VGVIVDSSILIESERERFDFEEFIIRERIDDVRIASVTASELLHGVERAANPSTRDERASFVQSILDRLPTEPFTLDTARIHARVWAALAGKGQRIGSHDLIIAATAIEHGLEVATLNEKEFRRIERLRLIPTMPYRRRAR